jgi:acyl-CoA synthetase (AMP-forming)/AMP-acid ligase II
VDELRIHPPSADPLRFDSYETLTQALFERAQKMPQQTALVFLEDGGEEVIISTAEFCAQASRYARALDAVGVGQEELVVLVLRHSRDLLFAFWGAMILGAIGSIFPFLTEKLDPQIYLERVKELVMHSQAKAVITFPEFKDQLSGLLAEAECTVLSEADVRKLSEIDRPGGGDPFNPDGFRFSSEKISFLQHSSGTTGLQKGVALSHRAVLNQIEAYSRAIELTGQDVVVSWLPLYHDMGLIAGFVLPIVAGVPLILMSPFKWVRDPKILLKAIQHYRGTLCWLPNFAYNHTARALRPRDLDGLDLSSMRAFINCSEPVYRNSHLVFLEKLAACGVRESMLSTCYAMAENTFAVTQHPMGAAARIDWVDRRALQEQRTASPAASDEAGSISLVSCGVAVRGTEIKVVDEAGQVLPERRVGEIALCSDCMLNGYYRRPDLTEKAIRSGWYHTGDMGYLAEGELYITGRKKDLIIVGGKNIYPQDLEAVVNEIPGVVPGRCVAFGLFDPELGSENIVMVCEVEDKDATEAVLKSLELEVRRRVVQQSEVALSDIRLVAKRWLIKTSSGKISRSANREKYIQEYLGDSGDPSD